MLKEMNDIPVSTKTIIATSNAQFDIVKIFQTLPIEDIQREGDCISVRLMYYQNQMRGDVSVLKKKNKKCFRNAVNVIMEVEPKKLINFKLSKNGKFQLTGCRSERHAIDCVQYFMKLIYRYCKTALFLQNPQQIRIFFQTVMTNVDFSLGFHVDRKRLDILLNQNTPFHSLLETSFGYTGVNIKFPLDYPWWTNSVPVITCQTDNMDSWTEFQAPLDQVGNITSDMKQKKRYNTFLVFHSGNVIMSGMVKQTMEKHYNMFQEMVKEWRNDIEEKILL